jgi:ssDNA-specific exonuclease RecJ
MVVLIDFESKVAKCTLEIERLTNANTKTNANANNDDIAQNYVERAYARLMSGHGVDKAIEDCSYALNRAPFSDEQKSFAYAIRAYAYFINSNYIQAQDDCERFDKAYATLIKPRKPETRQFVNELWCRLLQKKQEHKEALNKICDYFENNYLNAPDFLLSEQYRELRDYLKKEW